MDSFHSNLSTTMERTKELLKDIKEKILQYIYTKLDRAKRPSARSLLTM